MTLNKFWMYIFTEYPEMSKKSRTIHLPFSKSYLCERRLSAFTSIKTKKRDPLFGLGKEIKVRLSCILLKMFMRRTSSTNIHSCGGTLMYVHGCKPAMPNSVRIGGRKTIFREPTTSPPGPMDLRCSFISDNLFFFRLQKP